MLLFYLIFPFCTSQGLSRGHLLPQRFRQYIFGKDYHLFRFIQGCTLSCSLLACFFFGNNNVKSQTPFIARTFRWNESDAIVQFVCVVYPRSFAKVLQMERSVELTNGF